jgi:hypothetical protein
MDPSGLEMILAHLFGYALTALKAFAFHADSAFHAAKPWISLP